MNSIFQSEDAKKRLLDWHEKFKAKIPFPLESKNIQTQFGHTHVLTGGPKNAPPLLLLHGAMASSSHMLSETPDLLKHFRVYAVDIIGQSAKSEDRRLSVRNNDYGRWLSQVIGQLGLKKTHIAGVSWGGFTAIQLAALAPEKIDKLFLLVPAGIVNGPAIAGLTKLMIPMRLYLKNPTKERLQNFGKNLLTTMDDDWLPCIGDAALSFKMNMSVPRLVKEKELKEFTSPVFVMGAELDLSFPGEKLIRRSEKIFQNLTATELIKNSRHCPPTTDEFSKRLCNTMHEFFISKES